MTSSGRKKDVSDIQILAAVLASPDPVATSGEVGEQVGITRQGAHTRLQDLEDQALVESVKKGTRLWWLTDAGLDRIGDEAIQDSGS
jgi:predicted transcriptional regulator